MNQSCINISEMRLGIQNCSLENQKTHRLIRQYLIISIESNAGLVSNLRVRVAMTITVQFATWMTGQAIRLTDTQPDSFYDLTLYSHEVK